MAAVHVGAAETAASDEARRHAAPGCHAAQRRPCSAARFFVGRSNDAGPPHADPHVRRRSRCCGSPSSSRPSTWQTSRRAPQKLPAPRRIGYDGGVQDTRVGEVGWWPEGGSQSHESAAAAARTGRAGPGREPGARADRRGARQRGARRYAEGALGGTPTRCGSPSRARPPARPGAPPRAGAASGAVDARGGLAPVHAVEQRPQRVHHHGH